MDECGDKPSHNRHQHEKTCTCKKKRKETLAKTNLAKLRDGEPDGNLTSWAKLVEDRKVLAKKIKKATRREPINLLMNYGDKAREIKERAMVLENAQVEEKAAIRGSPWDQPNRLYQKCECQPVYEVQRTRIEMGKVSDIEYVAVPEFIQKEEKGIVGKYTRNKTGFGNTKYQLDREKQLRRKIERVEAYRPSLKTLIIKGNKPKLPTYLKSSIPVISFTADDTDCMPAISEVYALRINNTVLMKEQPYQCLDYLRSMQKEDWHQNTSTWTYYFNAPVSKMSRNKLTLTNLGTVALTYCWQYVSPNRIRFKTAIEPVFFFNKNIDVLSPGQSRELAFIFISTTAGIFEETWRFNVCNMEFLESGGELNINLNADAVESNLDYIRREIQHLTNYITTEERDYAIRVILNGIIDKAVEILPECYSYQKMFLDEHLFLLRNPDCYYHQTEVEKLKEMYRSILGIEDASWDLSIGTLKKQIMNQELDQRLHNYVNLKQSYTTLLKPSDEKISLPERKHAAVRDLLDRYIDLFEHEIIRLKIIFRSIRRGSVEPVTSTEEVCRQLLYLTMREHFSETVESIAALLSSLDLYRSIEFE